MKILNRAQIAARFDAEHSTALLKAGFIAYSQQQVQLPPVQHLRFPLVDGDCCIKTAYLAGDEHFVVKISSGFYQNPQHGLASNQGMMLSFSAHTGEPQVLLLDEGLLTALRTALAGRIVAELCAPSQIEAIGIIGTGWQARLQLEQLKPVTDCREIWVWGQSAANLQRYRTDAEALGFRVNTTHNAAELAAHCRLIITTTPSSQPILQAADIKPGTHITAVGADSHGKQELSSALVARADHILVDSRQQCQEFGEIAQAWQQGQLQHHQITEIGEALASGQRIRQDAQQITLADLTGLGIQDAQIVKGILR